MMHRVFQNSHLLFVNRHLLLQKIHLSLGNSHLLMGNMTVLRQTIQLFRGNHSVLGADWTEAGTDLTLRPCLRRGWPDPAWSNLILDKEFCPVYAEIVKLDRLQNRTLIIC